MIDWNYTYANNNSGVKYGHVTMYVVLDELFIFPWTLNVIALENNVWKFEWRFTPNQII